MNNAKGVHDLTYRIKSEAYLIISFDPQQAPSHADLFSATCSPSGSSRFSWNSNTADRTTIPPSLGKTRVEFNFAVPGSTNAAPW